MSVSRVVTITFADPILFEGHPDSKERKFHLNLGHLWMCNDGFALIDRFKLPLVSNPYELADWSREITEGEYLDLVRPPDFELLLAKHPGLQRMVKWRSQLGHEDDYGQIREMFHLISEFKRGNRPLRYQLTVSDMG